MDATATKADTRTDKQRRAAERYRKYVRRKREHIEVLLQLEVSADNLDAFIELGLLAPDHRSDHAAIEKVIG